MCARLQTSGPGDYTRRNATLDSACPWLDCTRLRGIDLGSVAVEQKRVGCPGDEAITGPRLADVTLITGTGHILCDVSTFFPRPLVPPSCVELCSKLFMDSLTLSFEPHQSSSRKGSSGLACIRTSKLGPAPARVVNGATRHNMGPIGNFPALVYSSVTSTWTS
ncbi:unnamed protein product [Dibothriocephalus latus]|uniref:Uncharacterized protein n=1 Tax=Dibothriocephalus latus TaxID=60516 RepID=A0A3P6PFY4_DIBLA|nr:unnamed protein product [Dibothriocephalus latus]